MSDAVVEGHDGHAQPEADEGGGVPHGHPDEHDAQLRHGVGAEAPDRARAHAQLDAGHDVVVQGVRQARAAFEVHVCAQIRAAHARRRANKHRDHEVQSRKEVHDACSDADDDEDDGQGVVQEHINALVYQIPHVFHSENPQVLNEQLTAEVRDCEEAKACR